MDRIEVLKERINKDLFELNNLLKGNERPSKNLYEFYRKGELVKIGTFQEIMDYTGYAGGTLTGFGQPAYLNKNKENKVNKLIKIGNEL